LLFAPFEHIYCAAIYSDNSTYHASISATQPAGVTDLDVVDLFPQTQKHTLGREVNLNVVLKPNNIKAFHVTSILPSQHGRTMGIGLQAVLLLVCIRHIPTI
jgi:hypothetical protein